MRRRAHPTPDPIKGRNKILHILLAKNHLGKPKSLLGHLGVKEFPTHGIKGRSEILPIG